MSESSIIIPGTDRPVTQPPASTSGGPCDHQDKHYLFEPMFRCYVCECGALVALEGAAPKGERNGLDREGRLVAKGTMREIGPRPPIVRLQPYQCGELEIVEVIVVAGRAPEKFPRFMCVIPIMKDGQVRGTSRMSIHADSIEQAFSAMPSIIGRVTVASQSQIQREELMYGVAEAAAGLDLKKGAMTHPVHPIDRLQQKRSR